MSEAAPLANRPRSGGGPTGSHLNPMVLRLIGVLAIGTIAAQLDTTMVNVAIDQLSTDLDSNVSTIQWVSTGYLLTFAMAVPLVGWASSRIGTKQLWMLSLALFFAASMLCGIAWSADSLIAFRILQGAGGGIMTVLFQSILAQAAVPGAIGRVLSIASLPAMLAPALGPVIGGLILANFSWRWIFFVNVPTCTIGLLLAWRSLPDSRPPPVDLDRIGLLLLAPAVAAVIYALSEAGTHGSFSSPSVLAPLLAGLVLLAGFIVYTLRTKVRPIIDLHLMRLRSYAAGLSVCFLIGFGYFAGLFLVPLFYQQAQGHSAVAAGLLLAPQGVGFTLGMAIVGRIGDAVSPRRLALIGTVLLLAGTVAYTQVPNGAGAGVLAVSLAVRGLGMSVAFIPSLAAIYYDIPHDLIPEGTSAQRIIQQIGGSLGTAIVAVILARQIDAHPTDEYLAFGNTFWWSLGFSALALIPIIFLPKRPNRERRELGHLPLVE